MTGMHCWIDWDFAEGIMKCYMMLYGYHTLWILWDMKQDDELFWLSILCI